MIRVVMAFNPFLEMNRTLKVVAIVDYLDCLARDKHFDPHLDAEAIAVMLRGPKMTREVWRGVAVSAGQEPPNSEAVEQIITVYERRALAANDRAVAS